MALELRIPSLRPDRLATTIPTQTYAGGWLTNPAETLCVWDSHRFTTEQIRGAVLCFYVDDWRFEGLWREPQRYVRSFTASGWSGIVEPDFSLWRDRPLMEQLYAIYRLRHLSRLYQEHGLAIVPNLTWSDERSFDFAFLGIPKGCVVAATECRSCGKDPHNRSLFIQGLREGIQQVEPQHVVIYGGADKSAAWLKGSLPTTTQFVLLPSWSAERQRYCRSLDPHYRQRHKQKGQTPCVSTTNTSLCLTSLAVADEAALVENQQT